jgi:hypothetical protein
MDSKRIMVGKNSEGGFALIIAIIGILIITAVGYFALTVSTGDLRIAARLVCERKAFSAAESGVHILLSGFSPENNVIISGNVDASGDPSLQYFISAAAPPSASSGIPNYTTLTGFSISGSQIWQGKTYITGVNGQCTDCGSSMRIDVAFSYSDTGGTMYR